MSEEKTITIDDLRRAFEVWAKEFVESPAKFEDVANEDYAAACADYLWGKLNQ